MELKRAIVSTDENRLYLEFWPSVAKAWSAMGIRPTLVLIAREECVDTTIGDVIRFDPIEGISTAMQAQVYRLFLPALFPEEGCLISDMDMIPISKDYFVESAEPCPDDAFVVYRNGEFAGDQYPMCYVAAKGKIFSSIFRIASASDFADRLRECRAQFNCWETDQLILFKWANVWQANGGNMVKLDHKVTHRLDRAHWQPYWTPKQIASSIDAHCPRPYSLYRESIDGIVQAVVKNNKP